LKSNSASKLEPFWFFFRIAQKKGRLSAAFLFDAYPGNQPRSSCSSFFAMKQCGALFHPR